MSNFISFDRLAGGVCPERFSQEIRNRITLID